MGKVLVDELAGVRLCGVGSQKQVHSFSTQNYRTASRRFLVAQVRDQIIQAMRNSDPRVRIVFVYRLNSNFHSTFTLWVAGYDFQYGPNFGVPSNPTFRVR